MKYILATAALLLSVLTTEGISEEVTPVRHEVNLTSKFSKVVSVMSIHGKEISKTLGGETLEKKDKETSIVFSKGIYVVKSAKEKILTRDEKIWVQTVNIWRPGESLSVHVELIDESRTLETYEMKLEFLKGKNGTHAEFTAWVATHRQGIADVIARSVMRSKFKRLEVELRTFLEEPEPEVTPESQSPESQLKSDASQEEIKGLDHHESQEKED